jgi:hypothetical protein
MDDWHVLPPGESGSGERRYYDSRTADGWENQNVLLNSSDVELVYIDVYIPRSFTL